MDSPRSVVLTTFITTLSGNRRKGRRMNFGKHGRRNLLGALVASSSVVVLGGMVPAAGAATANPKTIKVGDFPADITSTANDPHLASACLGIRLYGWAPDSVAKVTFTPMA